MIRNRTRRTVGQVGGLCGRASVAGHRTRDGVGHRQVGQSSDGCDAGVRTRQPGGVKCAAGDLAGRNCNAGVGRQGQLALGVHGERGHLGSRTVCRRGHRGVGDAECVASKG